MFKSFSIKPVVAAFVIATGLFGLVQPAPVQAQESAGPIAQEIDRFGLGLIGSLNLISPSLGAEISYRPPVMDDRLRVFVQYDFLTHSTGLTNPGIWLGFRHDHYHNPEFMNLRAYGQLRLGAMSASLQYPGENVKMWIPGVDFGIGAEAQLAGPLWGFAQISAGMPIFLRSEIGLRVAF